MKSMNGMPPQLHRAALMRRIFAKFDVDGNGTLNRKELQRATGLLGDRFSNEDIEVLMEILDKDHSDTIDMEEFIQAFMNKRR
jgi:Ca2+-binding EF-hand superfamily protein